MANTDQDALEQFRAILSETADIEGGKVEFYGDDPTGPRMVMPLARVRKVLPAAYAQTINQTATRTIQALRGIAADTLRDAADRVERDGGLASPEWLRDLADAHAVGTPGLVHTYSIEPETPPDRKAELVVEISDSVARDAEQLADMLHREGTEDDVAAAVASLAGYLADLAKDVKALAVIVAERGQP